MHYAKEVLKENDECAFIQVSNLVPFPIRSFHYENSVHLG